MVGDGFVTCFGALGFSGGFWVIGSGGYDFVFPRRWRVDII